VNLSTIQTAMAMLDQATMAVMVAFELYGVGGYSPTL